MVTEYGNAPLYNVRETKATNFRGKGETKPPRRRLRFAPLKEQQREQARKCRHALPAVVS